jgi:hypothetical protein
MILRSFVQRDDSQIAEYLEALEGGAVEGAVLRKDLTEGGLGASLGVTLPPISGVGKGGRKKSSETTAAVRRTPVSSFQLLYDLLDQARQIDRLEECDEGRFASAEVGQVIEAQMMCELSLQDRRVIELRQAMSGAGEFLRMAAEMKGAVEPLVEAAESLGVDLAGDDADFARKLDQIRQFQAPSIPPIGQPARLVVLGKLIGLRSATCVIPVRAATLQRDPDQLEGQLTVLGKVTRALRRGERLDPATLGALPTGLNREQRRQAASAKRQVVRYPALVLEPIAMYR